MEFLCERFWYAVVMVEIDCGDKIDIFEYDLSEMSVEALEGLLSVVSNCSDCNGCDGQIRLLEKYLEEARNRLAVD